MCSRYYFDSETEDTIRRITGTDIDLAGFSGDIRPSMDAAVLTGKDSIKAEVMKWGMPLILEEDQIASWLSDDRAVADFLKYQPEPVHVHSEYEQLSFRLE